MDITITVEGTAWTDVAIAIATVLMALLTGVLAAGAVVAAVRLRREVVLAQEAVHLQQRALRAQHLPVVSARGARWVDGRGYFALDLVNIGVGPAISPHVEAWVDRIRTRDRPHSDVLREAEANRSDYLSSTAHLEASVGSLGAGFEVQGVELRANESFDFTYDPGRGEQVFLHWRLSYGDVEGEMPPRSGTLLVAGLSGPDDVTETGTAST